jgi:hypothetical protein
MKTLEKISQHYQSAIAGGLEKLEVKEWDLDIYYRRTYPFSAESKIIELQSQGKTVEALVESVIVKSLDKDGKKVFKETDRVNLMNEADPAIIIRIAGTINGASLRPPMEVLAKE